MIIKNRTSSGRNNRDHKAQRAWNIFSGLVVAANVFIIAGLVFFASYHPEEIEYSWKKFDKAFQITSTLKSYPLAIKNAIDGSLAEADTLSIDISHKNMQKLEFMRRNAMAGERNFDFVPAKITQGKKEFKVKLRLKGDRNIHFESLTNSSYRVRIKGDNTLYGMKTFSLHKPRARNYIYEWIFLQFIKAEGLIAPDYQFVKLTVNGKDLGVYALEEHYDKYLIERHGLKDGPIIRFDEDSIGDRRYADMQVTPFKTKKWTKPELSKITAKAVNLLEAYKSGKLSVSEVFDTKKLAMFFAITDIMGTHHAAVPKSVRFYYNQITSRLEPIAYDGHNFAKREPPILAYERAVTPNNWIYIKWPEWFFSLFNNIEEVDPEFLIEYHRALEKVSAPGYMENFLKIINESLNKNLSLIYSEFPLEDNIFSFGPAPFVFDEKILIRKRDYIAKYLNTARIKAYLKEYNEDKIVIDIEVIDNKLPIKITGLSCNDYLMPTEDSKSILLSEDDLSTQVIHSMIFPNDSVMKEQDSFPACLEVIYDRPGLQRNLTERVYPWSKHKNTMTLKGDITRQEANYKSFRMIQQQPEGVLTIPPGNHVFNMNIIIPEGFVLKAEPGARLIFNNHAALLSRSPVNFSGTVESPVIITSSDNTGQGMIVLNADKESVLKNVVVKSLKHPDQNDWSLTGSMNFYASPLMMENVSFDSLLAEDALNIVKSNFSLKKLYFNNIQSDALDVDFGKGSLNESRFESIGNDAIDVSGSDIVLKDIYINKAGDKGISAGEKSIVKGAEIKIVNSELAIASKDSSEVDLENVDVSSCKVAFVAFQKKPEFGAGKIILKNAAYNKNSRLTLIEYGSELNLNGKIIAGDQSKIEDMLYGVTYGKSSK